MIERVILFHCASMAVPRRVLVADGGWAMVDLPFMGALLEHRERGPILIDAPFGWEGPSNLGSMVGGLLVQAGLSFREAWSVVPRVEAQGYGAADVEHVLMTHLHYDHTGGMKSLPYATYHLSFEEWEAARRGSGASAMAQGYLQRDYLSLKPRIKRHRGVPKLGDGVAGHDVFGDGSVEMVALPGHTEGHCGYRVHREHGAPLFFVGDAVFTREQLDDEGLGIMPRTVAADLNMAELTIRQLKRYRADHPQEILIASHDLEWGRRCLSEGMVVFESGDPGADKVR